MIRSETKLVSTGPEADNNETIKVREPPPLRPKVWKIFKKKSKKVEKSMCLKCILSHFRPFFSHTPPLSKCGIFHTFFF